MPLRAPSTAFDAWSKINEDLHRILCPSKPFVQCAVKYIFRLEPLPVGTQRQILVQILQSIGWTAKTPATMQGVPRQSMGPLAPKFSHRILLSKTQHGWVSVTKVRDQAPYAKPTELIATIRTQATHERDYKQFHSCNCLTRPMASWTGSLVQLPRQEHSSTSITTCSAED